MPSYDIKTMKPPFELSEISSCTRCNRTRWNVQLDDNHNCLDIEDCDDIIAFDEHWNNIFEEIRNEAS